MPRVPWHPPSSVRAPWPLRRPEPVPRQPAYVLHEGASPASDVTYLAGIPSPLPAMLGMLDDRYRLAIRV
jgi:hypothetical protein